MASELVYGYFHGGDPRDFTPDPECSTEAERAAWAEACRRWNNGDRTPVARPNFSYTDPEGNVIVRGCGSPFGLGTYTVDLGEYEPPERTLADVITWTWEQLAEEFCNCGHELEANPLEHFTDCIYLEWVRDVYRAKHGPNAEPVF
jgi:hypothetical protein